MNFATRLKQLREENQLRQEDLAAILKISRQAISNYEQGTRFPKDEQLLIAIADYFNVSTDYLLGRNPSSNPTQPLIREPNDNYYQKKILVKHLCKELENLPFEIIERVFILVQSIKKFCEEE